MLKRSVIFCLKKIPLFLKKARESLADFHKNNILTFYWEGSEEQAIVLKQEKEKFIRYQWLEDEGEEKYFEFRAIN